MTQSEELKKVARDLFWDEKRGCFVSGGQISIASQVWMVLADVLTPENPDMSPYGGSVINSYCHAWSCTPAYILKNFYMESTD